MRSHLLSDSLGANGDPTIAAEVAFASLFDTGAEVVNEHNFSWLPESVAGAFPSDSAFVIDPTGGVRVRGEVVAQVPLGMEPRDPIATLTSRGGVPGHGYRGFQRGCRCRTCCTGYCNTVGVVALRIEGWTLEAIAAVISRTRERVRQIALRHAPWRPWDAVQTEQRAERELIERARLVVGPELFTERCPTCGQEVLASAARRYCRTECREISSVLRYHIDDARRRAQRMQMAEWAMRNSDRVSPEQYRAAEKLLEHGPDHGSGKRWLIEGTETWRVAVKTCERGYPIFDALPGAIRRQVQQHLGMPVDEPCEEASNGEITAEEALEALDAFFTNDELH